MNKTILDVVEQLSTEYQKENATKLKALVVETDVFQKILEELGAQPFTLHVWVLGVKIQPGIHMMKAASLSFDSAEIADHFASCLRLYDAIGLSGGACFDQALLLFGRLGHI